MEIVSTWVICINLLLFILLALGFYFHLVPKTFFSWKINIVVIFGGVVLIALAIFLINLSNNIDAIFMLGSILTGPWIGYVLACTKSYLKKIRNVRTIKTVNGKELNDKY